MKIKELIKKAVLNNKYLTFFWLVRQNGNSFEKVNDFLGSDDFVGITPGKTAGDGSINYDIVMNNPNDGFFALTRWTLDYLYFADIRGFLPSVKWEKSLYADPAKGADAFELFFEPIKNSESPSSTAAFEPKQRKDAEDLNKNIYYQYSEEYIAAVAGTMAKYLSFRDEVRAEINKALSERGISSRVLGVHIRGTDYKKNYKNHPKYISPEEYYPHIDAALKTGRFDKIFLATDDNEILEEFIAHYGKEKILYADDINRGSGTKGIHINARDPYRAGVEVICDMACLAGCGGIVSSLSQVGLFARIYKKSMNTKYVEDVIVSNGINTNGQVFKAK